LLAVRRRRAPDGSFDTFKRHAHQLGSRWWAGGSFPARVRSFPLGQKRTSRMVRF